MPQLDLVTFFSQFFWLCIFYIGFYYILYKYFLPQYSRCILFRDRYSLESQQGASASLEEKGNIEESLSMYTTNAVAFSKNFFESSANSTGNWHKLCLKGTNEQNWKAANVLYIKTFGARQVSKNISRDCISYMVGKLLYSAGISKTCIQYCQNMEMVTSSSHSATKATAKQGEVLEKTQSDLNKLAKKVKTLHLIHDWVNENRPKRENKKIDFVSRRRVCKALQLPIFVWLGFCNIFFWNFSTFACLCK